MESCRIIVGLKCNFSCSYCCNETLPELMQKFKPIKYQDIDSILDQYNNICISGGEPLLGPNIGKTLAIARKAKEKQKRVFIYTNLSHLPECIDELINLVDGWSIGIHNQSNRTNKVQKNIGYLYMKGANGLRLHMEKSKTKEWDLIAHIAGAKVKPFTINNCDISDREDWYIIEG